MNKKTLFMKRSWLALSIVFTLLLLFDIAVGVFLPVGRGFSAGGARPDLPQGEDMPAMGERPQLGEMPDMSEMPDMGNMPGRSGGILYTVKTYAVPIGICCALCALLCLGMYARARSRLRREQNAAAPEETAELPAPEDKDGPKKSSFPWGRTLALILAAALGLSLLQNGSGGDTSGTEVIEENQSAQVTAGSLDRVLLSSGTLSESESESLRFAGNVRLLSWEVGENEVVVKGQTLASVDKNSVLSSISQVKELMDELDKALESSRSGTLSSTVTAPAAGRIVKIYAPQGESVLDIMGESGALMLLSLDGRLSLDICAPGLAAGDSVEIVRADGEVLEATVSEVIEGTASVTVGDTLCSFGEHITVLSPEGEELGSGELGIHRCLKVTGIGGTVSAVYVKEGAAVQAGQTLLSLRDVDYTGEYESLLARRKKLEEQMDALYALYDAGALLAPETGYVSALNTAAVGLETGGQGGGASPGMPYGFGLAAGEQKGQVQPLSAFRRSSSPVLLADEMPPPEGSLPEEPETVTVLGRVSAVDTEAGVLTLLCFDGSERIILFSELMGKCGGADLTAITVGYIIELVCSAEYGSILEATLFVPAGGANPGGGGGMPGGFTGGSFSGGSAAPEEEPSYTAGETELCTLTVFDRADISLTIDELDIRALSVGQTVEITLDALPGEQFSGSIEEIDPNGSNEGGSSKYTVIVTMERSSEMLPGMNATVRIPLDKHAGLLLLPAQAIQEDEGGVFVYTTYDEEDGYGGRREVATGLSDGSMVEITAGLSEGDTVYYPYAESVQYTFTQ